MKKIGKLVVILLAVTLFVCTLAACGGPEVGTWAPESFEVKVGSIKTSFDVAEMSETEKATYAEFVDMTLTFNSDGTVTSNMGDDEDFAKYKKDGDKIIPLDKDGNEADFAGTIEIVDGKLVMHMDIQEGILSMSVTLVFAKV